MLKVVGLARLRNAEDQMCITNEQLYRVHRAWCIWKSTNEKRGDGLDAGPDKLEEVFEILQKELGRCATVSHETDVFISGIMSGRKDR